MPSSHDPFDVMIAPMVDLYLYCNEGMSIDKSILHENLFDNSDEGKRVRLRFASDVSTCLLDTPGYRHSFATQQHEQHSGKTNCVDRDSAQLWT